MRCSCDALYEWWVADVGEPNVRGAALVLFGRVARENRSRPGVDNLAWRALALALDRASHGHAARR
jgi:hypothetical protein